jgi:NitT/TauT family transport system substrate-binding protein
MKRLCAFLGPALAALMLVACTSGTENTTPAAVVTPASAPTAGAARATTPAAGAATTPATGAATTPVTGAAAGGPTATVVPQAQALSINVALPWTTTPLILMMEEAADRDGAYKQQNLTVNFERIAGSGPTLQLLAAGRVDIAGAAAAPGLSAYFGGANDLRMLGCVLTTNSALEDIYATKKGIDKATDFKGKTLGITTAPNPTDPGYLMFTEALKSVNLTPDDVTWAVIGTQAQRVQALVAGRVDATTIGLEDFGTVRRNPNLQLVKIVPQGAFRTPYGAPGSGPECWWSRTSVLNDANKAQAIQRYLEGAIRTTRRLVNERDYFVSSFKAIRPDASSFSEDDLSGLYRDQTQGWAVNGNMNAAQFQEWLDKGYYAANPENRGKATAADVTAPAPLRAILSRIGVIPSRDPAP